MSTSRALVAVGLDHDRLCAVGATIGGDGVRVKGWVVASMPAGMDVRDAAAVGAWIGGELDRAGLGKRLVFAVPRGEVVLKRLKLPRGQGVGETELAGMVRLQMVRQLTMGIEGTAIDYVPVGEAGAGASTTGVPSAGAGESGAAGPGVVVMAAALPGDRTQWYQAVADGAGARVERLGLSSEGVAALLAGVSQRRTGPIMGVSVGARAVEFVVVEDGQLAFARSADVGTGDGDESALVSRIAVEAKRTWMSYRVGEGSAEVDAVVVAGEGVLAREIGKRCGESLEMQWEAAHAPAAVRLPDDMPESARLMAAPLLGLLMEEALSRPALDFAHPRRAPDLGAARRQRVLAGVLGLIVVGGGAYVYGKIELGRLQSRVNAAVERGNVVKAEYGAFLKDHARLSAIQQWTRAKVDWLAHVRWLADQMPGPRQALLDQIAGSMSAAVSLTPKDEWYDKGGWGVSQEAAFAIDGHTNQAEITRDLRERLLASGIYKVENKGADTPNQLAFVLTTNRPAPEAGSVATPAPAGPGKGGQK